MDPHDTLSRILDAFEYGDKDDAIKHMRNLIWYLEDEGIMPRLIISQCSGYEVATSLENPVLDTY